MRLFHYHLVTSRVKLVEARYLGRLGFDLVARYGWIGDGTHWFEPGKSWDELEAMGFRLRLIELARGAVNVVLQPGHWEVPRVDHLGIALDEAGYEEVVDRASDAGLKIQDHPGKRTFIATQAGLRVEVHPPREWIVETLERENELRLAELHLRAEDPSVKARALAEVLGLDSLGPELVIGESLVRFEPGGPEGRPELVGEVLE